MANTDSTDIQDYFAEAYAYTKSDKYDDAIRCYDSVIQVDPNIATAYYNKAVLLKELGRFEDAKKYSEKAKNLGLQS